MHAGVLKDQSVLVTGAAVGIGRAIALALARQGAFVGIHFNSSEDSAREVYQEILRLGGNGVLLQGNLENEAEAHRVVDEFQSRSQRLDILVNNAGTLVERKKIEETSLELWNRSLAINLTSAFLVTRRAIPLLRSSGNGRIINLLSLSVQTGGANGAGAYAAAKGGLQVFTRTLARELAPEIRVNALCPGVIETRHHEVHTSAERMVQYARETPLGRNGRADEVAEAALFLASPASSFVTGAVLDVSGGRFLR